MSEELAERRVRYLVADTETCGLGEHKKMCEVGIREIHPITLEGMGEWLSLIDPQHPIQPGATEVHGITDDMVADAPTAAEYRELVLKGEFDNCDNYLICHNAPFDVSLLAELMPVAGTICTLAWARRLIAAETANHKLQTLREHFGYPEGEAHRAMADVATTHRILRDLLQRAGMTLEQFARNGQHTVHTMPFGKHKGQLMVSLPAEYLIWLWNLDDLDENLRESVKKVLATHGFKPKKGAKIILEVER